MTAGALSMSCTQGQAFTLNISIVNPDDTEAALTYWDSKMQVRLLKSSSSALIELTNSNGRITHDITNGKIVLSLSSSETNALPKGEHVYDLELVSNGGKPAVMRLVQGTFTVG